MKITKTPGPLILREREEIQGYFSEQDYFVTFTFGYNIFTFPWQELFLVITANRLHLCSVY